jgi:hypothetical protein
MDRTTSIAVYAADRDWLQARQRKLSFDREKTVTMPDLIREFAAYVQAVESGPDAPVNITFEDHRWYTIVRANGQFLRAFAGGSEFSGLGSFDTEEEFMRWMSQ